MKKSNFCQEIEKQGYTVVFTSEQEDICPQDHYDNQKCIDNIINDYNNGNQAAWFCAKVVVIHDETQTESEPDYLGCCSYKTFDDFTGEDNGYFDDMIQNCLNDIEKQLKEVKEEEERAAAEANKEKRYLVESFHYVCVDDYENGEGEETSKYSMSSYIVEINPRAAIEKYFKKFLFVDDFTFEDAAIQHEEGYGDKTNILNYSYMVDAENCQASESEKEQWRAGDKLLYSNNVTLSIFELKEVVL